MSGHSKWSKIKRGKAITDAKKGKIFSKIARLITIAAKEEGGSPSAGPKLRMAIEQAKTVNMPNENIERAIKKGRGETEGLKMEAFIYEAYAPGGIALIIEGITDNKNRTLAEIKHLLAVSGGKLVASGSVSYLFQKKGVIIVNNEQKSFTNESLELSAIEAGAEDFKWRGKNILEIYTKANALEDTKAFLIQQGIPVESASLDWLPIDDIEIVDAKTKEQITKLLDALDEHDDVNEIYSNLKLIT